MQLDGTTIGWLLTVLGGFLLIAAVAIARRPVRLLLAGGRAEGTVVGREEVWVQSGKSSPRKQYRPMIRFAARDGSTHTFTSKWSHGKAPVDGASTGVMYDPAHPGDAEEKRFTTIWLGPLLCALFGVPLFLSGLSVLMPP